jgi:hypothetical protein
LAAVSLLGVVVKVVDDGGTGVVVIAAGVCGGDENGGSRANSMIARINKEMIAAAHSLRRGLAGSSHAPVGANVAAGDSILRVGGHAGIGARHVRASAGSMVGQAWYAEAWPSKQLRHNACHHFFRGSFYTDGAQVATDAKGCEAVYQ